MRQLSNTVSIKLRTVEAFKNQIRHIRFHRIAAKSRHVDKACANLEACVARLESLIAEESRLHVASQHGETVKKWRAALRNRSLRPLAGEAKAHLHLKLKVPHKEASNAAYIEAGELFAKTLRPHVRVLVENGMDEDCLEVLANSTAKLKQWTTQQSVASRKLDEVSKEAKIEMTHARELAGALNGAMVALGADDPDLLKSWNEARRIPRRIGQKREWGGHLKADKRKAKRDRSPKGRPFDFDEPLPQAPVEEPPSTQDPRQAT